MSDDKKVEHFGAEHAARYDDKFARVRAMKDALHLMTRLVFQPLADNAHVLCVGVGTGAELLYLADAFPRWRFCGLDTSLPMLEQCQAKARHAGISADRVVFHHGTVESLPDGEPFDAATAVLVSQFLTDDKERRGFFQAIADRLRPDGLLVSADICADRAASTFDVLFGLWREMMLFCGTPPEKVAMMEQAFGRDVAVVPPPEMECVLTDGGFKRPVLFCQTLLIHAWVSRRAD